MNHSRKLARTLIATAALSALLATNAFAVGIGTGKIVSSSNLNLRAEANTSSSIMASLPSGTEVAILDDGANGWYKVSYGTDEGYLSADYVEAKFIGSSEVTGTVTATSLYVRSGADTSFDQLGSLSNGTEVNILAVEGDWYKISFADGTGYVSSEYVSLAGENGSALGAQIVAYAKQFLGSRYVYGASGPNSFDCSGFTRYVYSHFGYSLVHSSSGQYSYGTYVSKSELQPGDLLFFGSGSISHVGLYIGNGEFIHASSSKTGVIISSLSSDWYTTRYIGARHIL